MKKLIGILTLFAVLLVANGCAIGFSGKRKVTFELTVLNNTLKWESSVDGNYTPEEQAKIDAEKAVPK